MSDLIKAGDVRINWRLVAKSSVDLKEGDIVACQGKGRIEVKSLQFTKKGKWSVMLVRYV